jgi:hypothetical protein
VRAAVVLVAVPHAMLLEFFSRGAGTLVRAG